MKSNVDPSFFLNLEKVEIPATSGNTNLSEYFKNINLKIDPEFTEFIKSAGPTFSNPGMILDLFQTMPGKNEDGIIVPYLNIYQDIEPGEACAIIQFLDSPEGEKFLTIPEGEEEINIILGYLGDEEMVKKVIFIEHEFENGVDEIHLHIRKLDKWGDNNPLVIKIT